MLVMSRGKWFHGLTWMPRLRRSNPIMVESTMRKSRPNLSRICSCHCTCREAGQTIENLPGAVPDDEFERHHPGLDGLAQAHVIGDQQVHPWHLDGPHHRIKLVVLDVDAGTKRGLDVPHVSRRRSTPAHGIEKGVELVGRIEAGGIGQGDLLDHPGPRLKLPNDVAVLRPGRRPRPTTA